MTKKYAEYLTKILNDNIFRKAITDHAFNCVTRYSPKVNDYLITDFVNVLELHKSFKNFITLSKCNFYKSTYNFLVFFTLATMPLYTSYLDVSYGTSAILLLYVSVILSFTDLGAGWIVNSCFYKKEYDINILGFNFSYDFFYSIFYSLCNCIFISPNIITALNIKEPEICSRLFKYLLISKLFFVFLKVMPLHTSLLINKANCFFIQHYWYIYLPFYIYHRSLLFSS